MSVLDCVGFHKCLDYSIILIEIVSDYNDYNKKLL